MFFGSQTRIQPRNGHTLQVGIVARISGCSNQKELSLEDQVDHGKQFVGDAYRDAVEYRTIATKGKGERLDRPELEQIERELRSRGLDLLVFEDLGRLVRGEEAVRLIGVAVDHGTRVIILNDCIDTAEPNWQEDALSAASEHVRHNSHTSKRLKYKLMNRFLKLGAAMARPIYGYIVPEDAKTYHDWVKDPEATPVIVEAMRRLKESQNCTAVAEWLNDQRVKPGPYCRRIDWSGAMVRRFFKNRLLGGFAGRGFLRTEKRFESGRRIPVKNPDGPSFVEYRHLAHIDINDLDQMNAELESANAEYRRTRSGGPDPLLRVPHNRSPFPGHLARCAYCGRHYVWGGNGITEHMMCSGSRERKCWNSVGMPGVMAAKKLAALIVAELYELEGFEPQWRAMVAAARAAGEGNADERQKKLEVDERIVKSELANISSAIAKLGAIAALENKLSEIQARDQQLKVERAKVEQARRRAPDVPETPAELRRILEDQLTGLAADSFEMGDLLRKMVSDFRVQLVRLIDGGRLLPVAVLKLNLAAPVVDAPRIPGLVAALSREITIELFTPPQRERIRTEAMRMAALGMTQEQIADAINKTAVRLPGETITATAVQRAIALHRKMLTSGLSSPYIPINEPPADLTKLRRHKHPNYRFDPLPPETDAA